MSPLKKFRAELHVHTVLSPCAEVEMIPPLIVQEALDLGINLLAITDHNSSGNISAVIKAAEGTGIHILPGMELQTQEEVHVLCIFDTLEQIQTLQKIVDVSLPPFQNNPDLFGEQFVVDETGDFLYREERLLLTSSSVSIKSACEHVKALGGILIPAHINRKAFGLLPTLGLIPEELENNPVMEISRHITIQKAVETYSQLSKYQIIQSGDVHRLDEFLGVNYFDLEEPTIAELKKAFLKIDERNFQIRHPNL
ncbi:MAG: PHP domain-containing protein [Chloroflexi bacterium]|nr:PHP domain-containing protein [Chloroflexota bacterium]